LASDVQNRRKQDGSHQVPIVNVSKALRVVPRLRAMFIARHGQALMFCVDRSTSKAPPHARGPTKQPAGSHVANHQLRKRSVDVPQ